MVPEPTHEEQEKLPATGVPGQQQQQQQLEPQPRSAAVPSQLAPPQPGAGHAAARVQDASVTHGGTRRRLLRRRNPSGRPRQRPTPTPRGWPAAAAAAAAPEDGNVRRPDRAHVQPHPAPTSDQLSPLERGWV